MPLEHYDIMVNDHVPKQICVMVTLAADALILSIALRIL